MESSPVPLLVPLRPEALIFRTMGQGEECGSEKVVVKCYRVELHFERHHGSRAVKRVSLPKESRCPQPQGVGPCNVLLDGGLGPGGIPSTSRGVSRIADQPQSRSENSAQEAQVS